MKFILLLSWPQHTRVTVKQKFLQKAVENRNHVYIIPTISKSIIVCYIG